MHDFDESDTLANNLVCCSITYTLKLNYVRINSMHDFDRDDTLAKSLAWRSTMYTPKLKLELSMS